ncbi:MAG: D-2-hydroxyacid dehydrogenase [Deltaproteobacteria bacterium]|nr:D-2-hydroxyacid dehydrogenase [Deltaproteobacteria bacterium]
MAQVGGEPLVVCLGVPVFGEDSYQDRLRAISPRVEPVVLDVDSAQDWVTANPSEPHDEPPPWAEGCGDARRRALERAEVMVALHTPKDLPSLAPRLRWIQTVGAGLEQFAAAGVRRDRVVITNASGLSAGSMAEFVVGRLLQFWKHFRQVDAYQQAHSFERAYGRTFAGSTIGIVGLGSIGVAVAKLLKPFRVRVLGLRRSARPGDRHEFADELYGIDAFHEMLAQCDAVVVAAPATNETRHMIDARALAVLPPHAFLVNVARGSLVDEAALAAALREGRLAGAALDVFEEEPLPPESPLWDVPNLYASAHSSPSVDRYMDDLFDLFEANLVRYVAGEPLANQVDMETLGFA